MKVDASNLKELVPPRTLPLAQVKINNARAEGLNNHVRLITRRAYGFHSPKAALALVMLSCGPIELHLPHEQSPD